MENTRQGGVLRAQQSRYRVAAYAMSYLAMVVNLDKVYKQAVVHFSFASNRLKPTKRLLGLSPTFHIYLVNDFGEGDRQVIREDVLVTSLAVHGA